MSEKALSMKEYIEERAVQIANYIIDENATVRQTAKKFGISKSTVHKDVTDRLTHINPALAAQARVVLGEWSDAALRICRQNIRRNSLTGRVVPMQADAREKPEKSLGEFQCIVSNPPYIPRADIETLDTSVKDYEPHLALDGGEDGLDFYRSISEKWKEALAPGGRLYFEVGIGQADNVLRIMRTQGFGDIQVVKDHHDIPRVVFGTLCTEL